MVVLERFQTPTEAHLVKAFLGEAGIESTLLDEHFIQWFWQYSNALGGVRLVVSEQDAEEAFEMLRDYQAAVIRKPMEAPTFHAWPLVLLGALFLGGPLALFGWNHRTSIEDLEE